MCVCEIIELICLKFDNLACTTEGQDTFTYYKLAISLQSEWTTNPRVKREIQENNNKLLLFRLGKVNESQI